MGVARDLYKLLGVAKDATAQEIKNHYYRLAKRLHPDTGHGDAERFKQVAFAYAILSDPEKRQRYDAGEDPDGIEVDNSKSRLVQTFQELLVQMLKKKDPKYDNLVEIMRLEVDGAIAAGEEMKTKADKAIATLKEAQERFSGDVEMVQAILSAQIAGMEKQKAKFDEEIVMLKTMYDSIKKMKYRVDRREKGGYQTLNVDQVFKDMYTKGFGK